MTSDKPNFNGQEWTRSPAARRSRDDGAACTAQKQRGLRSDNAGTGNRIGTRTLGDCVHVSSVAARVPTCFGPPRTCPRMPRERRQGSFFACRRITRMPSFSHAALFFPEGGLSPRDLYSAFFEEASPPCVGGLGVYAYARGVLPSSESPLARAARNASSATMFNCRGPLERKSAREGGASSAHHGTSRGEERKSQINEQTRAAGFSKGEPPSRAGKLQLTSWFFWCAVPIDGGETGTPGIFRSDIRLEGVPFQPQGQRARSAAPTRPQRALFFHGRPFHNSGNRGTIGVFSSSGLAFSCAREKRRALSPPLIALLPGAAMFISLALHPP